MTTTLVDLHSRLIEHDDGWRETGWVYLSERFRVPDPTRPGRFIYGPAEVRLTIAPDHGERLEVR